MTSRASRYGFRFDRRYVAYSHLLSLYLLLAASRSTRGNILVAHARDISLHQQGGLHVRRKNPFAGVSALSLGTPITLALLSAGDNIIAVSAAFGIWNGKLNRSNLPPTSLPVYDWIFATAPQHQCQHSL